MNRILFENLFDGTGINSGIGDLISQIKSFQASMVDMLNTVKNEAKGLGDSLGGGKGAGKGAGSAFAEIDKLYGAYEQLGLGIKYCEDNLKSLIATKERAARASKDLKVINDTEEGSIVRLKAQVDLAKLALEGMSESERKSSAEGQALANIVKSLEGSIKNYSKTLKTATSTAKSVQTANVNLSTAYSSLNGLIQKTGVNVESLLTTQKQLAIAEKNGEAANESLGGSYNQLYAQYNLIKNVLNAMSSEMRENTNVGRQWEAEALRIKDAMNAMQQATGNYTGSVGNYEKALNGLNISTMQVLREMPTLANSFSQFFIAISNNVPIFVDNLKRVAKETGSWSVAMKGVLTSVFSWQTILLVVLTMLPKVSKAISDKKREMEESNGVLDKNITYLDLLRDALRDVMKAQSDEVSDLRTIYTITQDVNRSMDERIHAAEYLRDVYEDQLEQYTAEEIALGRADKAVNNLTESLLRQAKARAYLDKITGTYSDMIDVQTRMDELGAEQIKSSLNFTGETIRDRYESIIKIAESEGKTFKQALFSSGGLTGSDKKMLKEYDDLFRSMGEYSKSVDEMTKKIDAFGLVTDEVEGSGRRVREMSDDLKDYYWTFAEEAAKIIQDPLERELAMNDVYFNKIIDGLQNELEERKKAGNLDLQQEAYLNSAIISLIIQREEKVFEIEQSFHQKLEDMKEDEVDLYADINKRIADNANELVESRKRLNADIENDAYRSAKEESVIYKSLLKEKLELEAELKRAILKTRYETGEISKDAYDVELANIEIALSKAMAKVNKVNKKGRFNIWSLIFGRTSESGEGDIDKELNVQQKAFIKSFEGSVKDSIKYMEEWMDTRIEMAQIAADAAREEAEAVKSALDYEMEARANGYANNVELARQEYEAQLKLEKEALAEKKRLEKQQRAIDTATQTSSLVTATAELWAAHASIPIAGVALAAAATAAMWGAFLAAKVKAAQVAQYGDGMSEYLDYGGSHASGNDIDFGVTKDGKRRRVERGEVVGVINKRNVAKYGADTITGIIDSLNKGTFGDKYTRSDIVGEMLSQNATANYGMAFAGIRDTDLTSVEQGISRLVEQGETRVVATPTGRIEYNGNRKRIIHTL